MARIRSKIEELELMQKKEPNIRFETYNNTTQFQLLRENLNERKYTVGETPVSYRVINHWANNELLPEGIKDGNGWKKFSFVEMVWLHAANEMRKFGLSLRRIAAVRNAVMDWDKKSQRYNIFEFFIAEALVSPVDPYIVVFEDDHIMLARAEQIEQQKILFGSQHMLLISVKCILNDKVLKNFLVDNKISNTDVMFHLSYEEKNLIEELRFGKTGQVKTVLKDGRITEIETSTVIDGAISQSAAAKEMRDDGVYGRVVTTFEKGVVKSVDKIKRKRFDK